MLLTSEQGLEIFANNPHIDKIIYHKKDSIQGDKLQEYFNALQSANECDEQINLCESIEVNLCLHPTQPQYNYSKSERRELCDKNYYDHTLIKGGVDIECDKLPEMFFTDAEEEDCARFRKDLIGKYVVLWCLSGSGRNKAYPYIPYVMNDLLVMYPEMVFITVGDLTCQIYEVGLQNERVIHKSGVWTFRQSAIMAKYANLVISPDTGMLHAAGCFETPKIGLLGHTTIENITKHFRNDYSIEAKAPCAPCFRLIYHAKIQCPVDSLTGACWCMAYGISDDLLMERIKYVIGDKLSIMRQGNNSAVRCA